MARLAPAYAPRRPEQTALYGIVREHLESFLAHARDHYDGGLPKYVEQEFRSYLRCGIFAHGFVRAHCDACGHDLLVAFSCKTRGICPSCNGRRMSNTAAHLVDRVLPNVPVRQYVLSLPFELRRLAAFRAEVLTALSRIFVEEIFALHRKRAPVANGESGAITFVQRFGGSLNLNVHFHVLVLDGVFTRRAEGVAFNEVPAPTRDEVLAIAERTKTRALAWLKRKGHLVRREDELTDAPTLTALEACAQLAMQRGEFADVRAGRDVAPLERPSYATAVETHGFNVHAGVRIARDDDLGREKLCRYGARPPFAVDRIRRLLDGRIAYQTKAASGQRARSRVMTPIEFLARLAALVPPPLYPLVRFHGVLAPKSSWRKEVVPKPPTTSARELPRRAERCGEGKKPIASSSADRRQTPKSGSERAATSSLASALFLSPNTLSVKHWNRLEEGLLLATTPRIAWPMLLRRCFSVDVLECARCGGRLRVMAVVTAEATVSKILDHLNMRSVPPPVARARAPDDVGEQIELGW